MRINKMVLEIFNLLMIALVIFLAGYVFGYFVGYESGVEKLLLLSINDNLGVGGLLS